jgi:DeoR family glycerol-3-phosphate regulon repressor
MFLPSPRQSQIITLARHSGRVSVDDLAERYQVTPQTIRKDLNELCDEGVLTRTHGGAILASGVENVAYEARRQLANAEKRAIGLHAASLIPNEASLFINIGTTTEEVARALVTREGLLVITNNIHVVSILLPSPRVEVIVAGGMVRRADGGIVGEATIDLVSQFMVDYAIIGASAIGSDGSLLDFDYREVRVSQKIIENARHVILVADSMKFTRSAPVRIGHISQVDVFVTDRPPPPPFSDICRRDGVKVEIVGGEHAGRPYEEL